jgi:hypothetical protein
LVKKETTDKEDKLLRELWIWELETLNNNKDLAWNNKEYKQEVEKIKN